MNKDNIRNLFPDASDDAVKALLDINSADITKALGKQSGALEQAQRQAQTLQDQLNQRDTDLTALRDQLTAAQADAGKLAEAQQALADMQSTYNADRQAWEQQKAAQAYEFAVKSRAGELKFTSNAAKNDFVRSAIEKGMKLDGDRILGFEDYLKSYREADPGAFAPEQNPGPAAPTVVLPAGTQPPLGHKMTLSEAMKRANAGEKIDVTAIG